MKTTNKHTVTGDTVNTTRNARYEHKLRQQGLVKVTVWVPQESSADFKQMAVYCCEHKGHVPYGFRNIKTGRFGKAV